MQLSTDTNITVRWVAFFAMVTSGWFVWCLSYVFSPAPIYEYKTVHMPPTTERVRMLEACMEKANSSEIQSECVEAVKTLTKE